MFSNWSKLTFILFIVIFLEGYIVLASEILAIRQVTTYVGSGADTVSIIIAAVLMPLAFGYYVGGNFKPKFNKKGKWISIRKKLVSNVVISACFLIPALATLAIDGFFTFLFEAGVSERILLTSIYSFIFLIVPVFLLGQTVPLVSNYFSSQKLPLVTAKILFVSTAGSFMGSVITTIVIMRYFGVNNAVNVIAVLLVLLVVLLSKKVMNEKTIVTLCLAAMMLYLNSDAMLRKGGVIYSNAYNTAAVIDVDKGKILSLNNSASSFLGKNGEIFPYGQYVEKHYLNPISKNNGQPPKKILIIGAAGFTVGSKDDYNDYTYIDIDPDIKKAAEKEFLKKKLGSNKKFVGQDIIAYLSSNKTKYDLILMDAFSSRIYIPENLVTKNFFMKVKDALEPNGFVLANFILSPNFSSSFSKRIDNTFRVVFPNFSRQVISEDYNAWSDDSHRVENVIYSYRNTPADDGVYTYNNNTAAFDKPDMVRKDKK